MPAPGASALGEKGARVAVMPGGSSQASTGGCGPWLPREEAEGPVQPSQAEMDKVTQAP